MEVASDKKSKKLIVNKQSCHGYLLTSSQSAKIRKKILKIYMHLLNEKDFKFCFDILKGKRKSFLPPKRTQ